MQSLREAGRHAVRCLAQRGSVRTYKDLPVHKNPFVEAWYDAREDMEMTATITGPMLVSGFFWGLLVPYVVFEAIVAEQRITEQATGKPFLLVPDTVDYEKAPHQEE
jgi:hypothetical protein